MKRRQQRIFVGLAIWGTLALGLGVAIASQRAVLAQPVSRLAVYMTHAPDELEVELPGPLVVGDPVLDRERRQIGRVVAVSSGDYVPRGGRDTVTLAFDPEFTVPLRPAFVTRGVARDDSQWVFRTLIPEHKRDVIAKEIAAFLREHEAELAATFRPMAEDAVQKSLEVFQANLAPALKKRQSEIHALFDRHRGMVKDEVLPVLKERLGPCATEKLKPIMTEVGREVWQEVSIWSVGWRASLDAIPYAGSDRVDRWWAKFLEEKVIPIVSSHENDLIKATEDLLEEGAEDPEVRRVLGEATIRLSKDENFKKIMRGVLEDALIRPFDMQELIEQILADPTHKRRMARLQQLMAPTLKRIARNLTVDEETGRIDPGLARVLRRVVFNKDKRWVELVEVREF